MSVVSKRLDGSRCYLVRREASAQATLCYTGTQFTTPLQTKEYSPQFFWPCLLWPNGRLSQLLLSTCMYSFCATDASAVYAMALCLCICLTQVGLLSKRLNISPSKSCTIIHLVFCFKRPCATPVGPTQTRRQIYARYRNKCSAVAEMDDRLATMNIGRKLGCMCPFLGESWSPSNTMLPGPRHTFVPSRILIHPAVWPQKTWAENWGVPLWGSCVPI